LSEPADESAAAALSPGEPIETPRAVFGSRPVLAVLAVLVCAAIVELVPGLEAVRILRPRVHAAEPKARASEPLAVGQAELGTETEGHAELAPGGESAPMAGPIAAAPQADEVLDKPPQVPIVDPSGRALTGFFRALERTRNRQSGAITRIVHFGDSIVASDYVSGTLRRRFQERFGDAGHGFTLIANAWPAYFHNDVERYATAGWKVSRVVGPLTEDGYYGLGCVSFLAEKNVLARIASAKKGDFGRNVSRFIVFYLEAPNGGSFEVSVDGVSSSIVDTRSEQKRSAFHEVRVPDGPHELTVLTKRGVSRLFGVALERDVPGVVLDAIGVQGARIRFLDKQDDAHWAEQLRARHPDLLIYEFGANESADGLLYPMADYHRTMREVVEQGRRALPDSSCLVIGAMDRASKNGDELRSLGVIPLIVEEQRKVASEVGCAFFDTYEAMGGRESMPRWVRRGLGQADLTHPSSIGSDLIGTWIYRALMQRYGEFLATTGGSAPKAASASSSPSLR
jgi:hypothetical protein